MDAYLPSSDLQREQHAEISTESLSDVYKDTFVKILLD